MHTCTSWLLVTLLCLCCFGMSGALDERVSELLARQQQARDAVVHLNTKDFERLALTKPRDFSLVVFFSTEHLKDHPVIKLADLRQEFGYTAKAFAAEPASLGKIFFSEMAFEESKDMFMRLGVNTVPYLVRWGPEMDPKPAGVLPVPEVDRMHVNSTRKYPWSAEDMGAWVVKQTGLKHAAVDRPSFMKSPLFPLFLLFALGLMGYVGVKVYQSKWIRHKAIWASGVLVIYWFSSSGGMFNIIRGMPMYIMNKDGKPQYFLGGQRGAQLGVEGFFMGGTYMVLSLLVALFTYWLPRLKDRSARNAVGLALICAAMYMYWKIFDLYKFKTGMGSSNYLMDD